MNWATENFAARAANLAWKCLATNHSGGKRQTDRKTMRQMSERERERENDKERERGGVCVNEGQVRTEKWHLTRSAAFAYFVANCCSTGC